MLVPGTALMNETKSLIPVSSAATRDRAESPTDINLLSDHRTKLQVDIKTDTVRDIISGSREALAHTEIRPSRQASCSVQCPTLVLFLHILIGDHCYTLCYPSNDVARQEIPRIP